MAGDGEASFRLAQFYGMAGGKDGRTDRDLVVGDDAVQELRWLEPGASQGQETARFNLAVKLAQSRRDCTRGRAMIEDISRSSSNAETRENAGDWLQDLAFQCDGVR